MKIRVAVVMGGHTSEYEISLKSGAVVMAHLDQNKYEAYAVRVTDNVWSVAVNSLWRPIDKETFSSGDLHFDVVFNAVHGAPGENGVLQSYFDNLGIPYSGCSSSASALTYDKAKTLDYLESHDIAMAKRLFFTFFLHIFQIICLRKLIYNTMYFPKCQDVFSSFF